MGIKKSLFILSLVTLTLAISALGATLSPYYYDKSCPYALPTIKKVIKNAVKQEARMGASILRLHFHDCFVNGCDASILLDQTSTIDSEKNALPNRNSVRGFDVIDKIKSKVDKVCGRPTVSCADILAVAARDSVVALGGPTWQVKLGRRDSTTASRTTANNDMPSPFMNLSAQISSYQKQGLDVNDLVALSGGHTIGFAQCVFFKNRIYNETTIDSTFASQRQKRCPPSGGDTKLAPLDQTTAAFDTKFFSNLVKKRGLLHSDQALFSGGATDGLVTKYSTNQDAFWQAFAKSMVKMGNIKPLTGNNGQIRVNCRKVNSN